MSVDSSIQRQKEETQKSKFDGKDLIKDALILDALVYLIILSQYLFIPLFNGMIMYDLGFLSFALFTLAGLSIVGAIYYKLLPVSVLLNSLLLLAGFAMYAYMSIFFNGPFDTLMFIFGITMMTINGLAYIINIRGHWGGNLGKTFLIVGISLCIAVYLSVLYGNLIDFVVTGLFLVIIIFSIESSWKYISAKRFRVWEMFNDDNFIGGDFFKDTKKKLAILGIIVLAVAGFGYGFASSWNKSFTIKAEDDFYTSSSYWGPPGLTLETINSNITVTDLNTLQLSNATLDIDPDYFKEGALAYAINVTVDGDSTNYLNYSAGAMTYPNGTIVLSESLPALHGDVNVTFKYVKNNDLLKYLNISQSTLIMNYHGDFIYSNNTWDYIEKNYLFQLLDYWQIKFYLDISNGIEFPHIFNYQNSVPIGYTTLYWADGKWDMFQGISYDFEPGGNTVAPGSPGGINMTIGDLIGDDPFWQDMRHSWYHSNEQNYTLIEESTAAYENLYAEVSRLGYKTYITLGRGELDDAIDGDIDYTRCPVGPITENPDVLFGIMCYQDAKFGDLGRYRVWRDCVNQISQLGDQGKTILLGWLAVGTSYYTDDEVGLQRYIEDVKIAQAAGMVEIYHAPIYRMQRKWGDDAVLKLHDALNEDPKEEITITVPFLEMNENFLYDYIENFNKWYLFVPVMALIVFQVVFNGTFNLKSKISKRK